MINAMTSMAQLASPVNPDARANANPGKQVEVLFARMLIKEMRKAMPEDGPFGGKEMSMYMDLLDDVLAERIAESGNMGIADQMNRVLQATDGTHLRSASDGVSSMPAVHANHHHAPQSDTLPVKGTITSNFGNRVHPITGKATVHTGMDIAADKGTDIHAVRPGTVTFAGHRGGYGLLVVVDHGNGLETRYAHCSALRVKAGETIARGQIVGDVGSTGRSTGNHLHFEARKDGTAVDPKTLFQWRDEESSKTQPQLVRQSRREGL